VARTGGGVELPSTVLGASAGCKAHKHPHPEMSRLSTGKLNDPFHPYCSGHVRHTIYVSGQNVRFLADVHGGERFGHPEGSFALSADDVEANAPFWMSSAPVHSSLAHPRVATIISDISEGNRPRKCGSCPCRVYGGGGCSGKRCDQRMHRR
jgi:hypothetical protein